MLIKPGIYRHFKGNEYEVIGTVKHSETQEDMVLYKPLTNDSGLWVRPLNMFTERVELAGEMVERFERLPCNDV